MNEVNLIEENILDFIHFLLFSFREEAVFTFIVY